MSLVQIGSPLPHLLHRQYEMRYLTLLEWKGVQGDAQSLDMYYYYLDKPAAYISKVCNHCNTGRVVA
jgi:hypothetical protein